MKRRSSASRTRAWVPPEAVLAAVWIGADDPHAAMRLGVTLGFCEDGLELQRRALAEWPADRVRCWCAEHGAPVESDAPANCLAAGAEHARCYSARMALPGAVAPSASVHACACLVGGDVDGFCAQARVVSAPAPAPAPSARPEAVARGLRLAAEDPAWTARLAALPSIDRVGAGRAFVFALETPGVRQLVRAWPCDCYADCVAAWAGVWPLGSTPTSPGHLLLCWALCDDDGACVRAMLSRQQQIPDDYWYVGMARHITHMTDPDIVECILARSAAAHGLAEMPGLYDDVWACEQTVQDVLRRRWAHVQPVFQMAFGWTSPINYPLLYARLFATAILTVQQDTVACVTLLLQLVGATHGDAARVAAARAVLRGARDVVCAPVVEDSLRNYATSAENAFQRSLGACALIDYRAGWRT